MAIPMLCTRKGEQYSPLVERWHQGEGELDEMERDVFGWDHAEVAALICSEWEFPDIIAEAIASHHGSRDPEIHELPPVTLAARIREIDAEGCVGEVAERAHAVIGLDVAAAQSLVEESFRHAEEIAEQFA